MSWLGGARGHSDVRLVVGGRALPAHRAVLASASPFLKGILLSCPVEESPTYIVLPDFDLDAMSSILYYIYNGEVTIEKHKIEMCLDIIKSMQIYIDYHYLPNEYKLENEFNRMPNAQYSENVSIPSLDNKIEDSYVEIKKGKPFRESTKYIPSVCVPDKDKGFTESKVHNKLENVQFENRQRNSFLRDLYIETFPRNGKANGQTSVRAITNERYHAATSTLSSNANSKHLSAEDAPTQPSNKTTHHTPCLSMEMQNYEVNYQHIHNQINGRIHRLQMSHDGGSASNFAAILHARNVENYNAVHGPVPLRPQFLKSRLPNDVNESLEMYKSRSNELHRDTNLHKNNISSRVPILNQVLDSPWSARKPANFIPFHKQEEKLLQKRLCETGVKENEQADENDSNNNVATDVKEIPNNAKDLTKASNNDSIKCTKCDQIFPTAESLSEHARCHTGRYTCPDCGKNFSQLRNFKYHVSVHRGTREFAATCPVCGKYFNDRGYLSSHMKIHKNRKEYKCSMCPKSFNQRVAYNMHVRIHTGVKPHVCGECGKAFSRKMLLKQHQRTHSGERPYACPHCDKRFADRSNMTLHLRLHTGVKPFSCTLCPKSFTKKHHLKSHLNFHTGAKPYSCPNCNLAFTQSSNMRTHMKKCTTATPSEKTSTATS